MRDELQAGAWGTVAWFWVVGLIVGAAMIFLYVQPYVIKQETKNIRASNSYITTQQTALVTLKTDYDRLELYRAQQDANPAADPEVIAAITSQQAGIVAEIKRVAALIPDDVPAEVRDLLRQGG